MNEEVSKKLLNKQMLYYIVLNFMELPHVGFVAVYLYCLQFKKQDNLSEAVVLFLSICEVWYAARGIVLPILRICIEPKLLF
jgi:hypothetical protein